MEKTLAGLMLMKPRVARGVPRPTRQIADVAPARGTTAPSPAPIVDRSVPHPSRIGSMLARAFLAAAIVATGGCDDLELQIHVDVGAYADAVTAVYVELYSVAGDAPFDCDDVAF